MRNMREEIQVLEERLSVKERKEALAEEKQLKEKTGLIENPDGRAECGEERGGKDAGDEQRCEIVYLRHSSGEAGTLRTGIYPGCAAV